MGSIVANFLSEPPFGTRQTRVGIVGRRPWEGSFFVPILGRVSIWASDERALLLHMDMELEYIEYLKFRA